jgi:hypothetical protein
MSQYTDPQPEECEACLWKTDQLTKTDAYARQRGHGPFTPDEEKTWAWLCDVCRSSFSGMAYCYPNNYPDSTVLWMIAWQTNYLTAQRRDIA